MKHVSFILFLSVAWLAPMAQLRYSLDYEDTTNRVVRVSIVPDRNLTGEVDLVMPRSIPGAYSSLKYDHFLVGVEAVDAEGHRHTMKKNEDDGPRWHLDSVHGGVRMLQYQVDLGEMETMLGSPSDASIARRGFVGLLNYSVLGWIDGLDDQPLTCSFTGPPGWPIFSTLQPSEHPQLGKLEVRASSYHVLADGQTYMGPAFQVKRYDADVPLYIVSFAEGEMEYLEDYAWQERWAMGALKAYIGPLPFSCYSLMLRRSIPLRAPSAPTLAMEHLQSSTFFGDTSATRRQPLSESNRQRSMSTYLHHMGHAYIPLRCYGDAYRPRMMEVPPVIDDIWFNEGFIWYMCYDTLHFSRMMQMFREAVFDAPASIRKLDLLSLSRIASTQYGDDFRLGMATFSRGALMAHDMNEYLLKQTKGRKSMRDVLQFLYRWAQNQQRPFTMAEFPGLLQEASGVDMRAIYEKWLKAVE